MHLTELTLWSVLDILVLAVIIYQLILLIRGTRSLNVLLALLGLVLLWFVTGPGILQMGAVHEALGSLFVYVPLAVIVLFQNQIRKALAILGKNPLAALLPRKVEEDLIEEVTLAAASLASKRLGALIVIEREIGLRSFIETGIQLDAIVSYDLLLNIFTRRSPLHDGAAIIAEGRIKAASCYLPLTISPSLSRTYGTRHRAAIGITEESDALVIVASEERGVLSLAEGGSIREDLDAKGLSVLLHRALNPRVESKKRQIRRVISPKPTDA